MFFPASIGPEFQRLAKPIWESDAPDNVRMGNLFIVTMGLQGYVLSHLLLKRIGDKVFSGPFRGMQIIRDVMDRHFAPILLGTYEWELHDAIEQVIAKKYKQIVNIGCAFGFYSVGLARRMPETKVYAFDIDPRARELCRKMAEANGVADRVIIDGRFTLDDFARFAGPDTLVFIDIEGGEDEMLDPLKAPALLGMDVIVELHDCLKNGLSTVIPLRFAPTHHVRVIPNAAFSFPLEKIMGPDYVPEHFDNLLATWEGRAGPTPFGVFIKK